MDVEKHLSDVKSFLTASLGRLGRMCDVCVSVLYV